MSESRVQVSAELFVAAFMALFFGAVKVVHAMEEEFPPEDAHRYQPRKALLKNLNLYAWWRTELAEALGVGQPYLCACASGRINDIRVRSAIRALKMASGSRNWIGFYKTKEEAYVDRENRVNALLEIYTQTRGAELADLDKQCIAKRGALSAAQIKKNLIAGGAR